MARIIHVSRNTVRVEVYGFESYVRIDSISNVGFTCAAVGAGGSHEGFAKLQKQELELLIANIPQ